MGDVSEEEGLWESLEIDGRMLVIWRDAVGLLQIRKLKVTVKKREKTGGRRIPKRPCPENCPKHHRRSGNIQTYTLDVFNQHYSMSQFKAVSLHFVRIDNAIIF
jgi:hypothetical protein